MNTGPKNFEELVSWATWQVIEGLTQGKPLRSTMFSVLQVSANILADWDKARREEDEKARRKK